MPRAPLLRVPYTDPLPLAKIIPASATTTGSAVAALVEFLSPCLPSSIISPGNGAPVPASSSSPPSSHVSGRATSASSHGAKAVLLTGAGISVASGLADYRGANGTYTLNKAYRPIYYNEFCDNHEARKRYWARSFLGWTNLNRAKPNKAHDACGALARMGVVGTVITQNVDSFHSIAHPLLQTTELHGYLRALVCLSCRNEYSRQTFQSQLSALNPAWDAFLEEMLASGALDTENPDERRKRGLKMNPDGDVGVPGVSYTSFRYPACPVCLETPPLKPDGAVAKVLTDKDGAWNPKSEGGVLKPAVIMFGESIPEATKVAAEQAVNDAERILVVGSSLATYSAWRLVKRARERHMAIGVLNIGGVRGEGTFFEHVEHNCTGREAVRLSDHAETVLPQVVDRLQENIKQNF